MRQTGSFHKEESACITEASLQAEYTDGYRWTFACVWLVTMGCKRSQHIHSERFKSQPKHYTAYFYAILMPVCIQQTDDNGWEESRHSQSESPRSQTMSPASESSPVSPDVRGLQRALESLRNKDRKINQYSSHPGLEEVLDTNQQVCACTCACV